MAASRSRYCSRLSVARPPSRARLAIKRPATEQILLQRDLDVAGCLGGAGHGLQVEAHGWWILQDAVDAPETGAAWPAIAFARDRHRGGLAVAARFTAQAVRLREIDGRLQRGPDGRFGDIIHDLGTADATPQDQPQFAGGVLLVQPHQAQQAVRIHAGGQRGGQAEVA